MAVLFVDGLPVAGVAGVECAPFWFNPGIASMGSLIGNKCGHNYQTPISVVLRCTFGGLNALKTGLPKSFLHLVHDHKTPWMLIHRSNLASKQKGVLR